MKKIKFIDLSFKNPVSLFLMVVIILLLVFVLLNLADVFSFENKSLNKILTLLFYLTLTVNFARILLHKNVFAYNKKGFNIRVNQTSYKSLSFANISRVNFQDNNFTITNFEGSTLEIDLANIHPKSKLELEEILKKHTSLY